MTEKEITTRAFQNALGVNYCDSTLHKGNISRSKVKKIASILNSNDLHSLTRSDIFWEKIKSIKHIGREMTYDLHVQTHHNFVADDFIIHNSGAIEQDADIVSFIYRPEYYQILEDEEGQSLKGVAEIIIAKHRNGALDTIKLRFTDKYARFNDLDEPDFEDLGEAFENPNVNVITRPSKMNDDEDIPF